MVSAQDNNLYEKTNLSENMTYGIIKSSIIHLQNKWHLIMVNTI